MTLAMGSIMSQGLVINVRKQLMEKQKETEIPTTVRSGTRVEYPSVFEYTLGEEMSVTAVESYESAGTH